MKGEVIKSITFAGDNSGFTGTFFLHPAITRIVFEKEESVIGNLSIPDAFPNNSCKCINNYQNLQKNINIYFPNNGRFGNLNVLCNSKVILNSFGYHKSNLYFLNIKHFPNNFSVADNISLIQLKYKTYGLQDININTTQNVIKMKENYYKALINRDEKTIQTIIKDKNKIKRNLIKTQEKLTSTEKDLNNTCKELQNTKQELRNTVQDLTNTKNTLATTTEELKNTDNMLQTNIRTNTNNITKINNKIGEVKVEKVEGVDRIISLQTQINTINEETIGKDETVGLRKRIKELENYINANIPIVTIPMTSYYSSYLKFEEHVDARRRLWSLSCSTCSNPICKFEVHKYYDRSIPTITYNGTIDDLVSKVNSDISACTVSTCAAKDKPHTFAKIDQTEILKYTKFIQKNNCVYTGYYDYEFNDYSSAYDLYCNVCGIHFPSINHGTNDLLDTGEKILNKLKEQNSNSDKCTNAKCTGTFDKTTFDPNNTIKQSIINFYPLDSENGNAFCNFIKHKNNISYDYQLLDNLTGPFSSGINRIKTDYIGKKHCDDSICGARWVGAIYPNENYSVWIYLDVDDCKIIDETV